MDEKDPLPEGSYFADQRSAREAVAAHLARIDEVNPAINAVVTLDPEAAFAAADAAAARPPPRPGSGAIVCHAMVRVAWIDGDPLCSSTLHFSLPRTAEVSRPGFRQRVSRSSNGRVRIRGNRFPSGC